MTRPRHRRFRDDASQQGPLATTSTPRGPLRRRAHRLSIERDTPGLLSLERDVVTRTRATAQALPPTSPPPTSRRRTRSPLPSSSCFDSLSRAAVCVISSSAPPLLGVSFSLNCASWLCASFFGLAAMVEALSPSSFVSARRALADLADSASGSPVNSWNHVVALSWRLC